MDLKEIFINELQKRVVGMIYAQELNNKFECIVKGKNKSNYVIFKYNDNKDRKWEFDCELLLNSLSSSYICIFVCKDENNFFEYHVITLEELLSLNNINILELMNIKDKNYLFEDVNCIYKDNWKVF